MGYNLIENFRGLSFEAVSVILPVISETDSLLKTIEIIERDCNAHVLEYIIVVCEKTTGEALQICEALHNKNPKRFILHFQHLPFLGGAVREAFELARASHTIMMASDLETDPNTVREFIALAMRHPNAIITASRWIRGGEFEGYDPLKLILNYIFQKLFSYFYRVNLTDMTFGYRIFPTRLVQSVRWEDLKHPFLFETLIKPLRLKTEVIEVPSVWHSCSDGVSQNTFLQNFYYFAIGFKVLFYTRKMILK